MIKMSSSIHTCPKQHTAVIAYNVSIKYQLFSRGNNLLFNNSESIFNLYR